MSDTCSSLQYIYFTNALCQVWLNWPNSRHLQLLCPIGGGQNASHIENKEFHGTSCLVVYSIFILPIFVQSKAVICNLNRESPLTPHFHDLMLSTEESDCTPWNFLVLLIFFTFYAMINSVKSSLWVFAKSLFYLFLWHCWLSKLPYTFHQFGTSISWNFPSLSNTNVIKTLRG